MIRGIEHNYLKQHDEKFKELIKIESLIKVKLGHPQAQCNGFKEEAFLEQVKIGQWLKGEFVRSQDQVFLRLFNGTDWINGQLQGLQQEEAYQFLVVDKGKDFIILQPKPVELRIPYREKDLIEQAFEQFNIEKNPTTYKALSQLIEKQLPLLKQSINQVIQVVKKFDIPTEVPINMLSDNKPLLDREGKHLLMTYKGTEVREVSNQLQQVLLTVSSSQKDKLIAIMHTLYSDEEVLQCLDNHEMGIEIKENKIYLAGQTDNNSPIKARQVIDKILKNEDIKIVKEFMKELFDTKVTVHIGKEKETFNEIEKMLQTNKFIQRVLSTFKESSIEGINNQNIQVIEKISEVIEKYNMHGHYFCFPLALQDKELNGELYFFKPKKSKAKDSSRPYIVLSLDMPALNKIEIHLKEHQHQLGIFIKVQREEIKDLINGYIEELKVLLSNKGAVIGFLNVEVIQEKDILRSCLKEYAIKGIDTRV